MKYSAEKKDQILGAAIFLVFGIMIYSGYLLKSSQDKERYHEIYQIFEGSNFKNQTLINQWNDYVIDRELSNTEVTHLICTLNKSLCLPWYRIYLPLPFMDDAHSSMAEFNYLKRALGDLNDEEYNFYVS